MADRIKIFTAALSLILLNYSGAQIVSAQGKHDEYYDPDKKFSISLIGTYVSSSELLENPTSPNPFEREAATELKSGYGYGAEMNYAPLLFESNVLLYLSAEYLKVNTDGLILRLSNGVNSNAIRFSEKFTLIPIEFGIKWLLPVSTDLFKLYIGGGGGIYLGDRIRTIQNLVSSNIKKKPGFSLNVLTGLEYYIARNLSANLELKFREASFDNESKYNTNTITVGGTQYSITNPFTTRFIIDGVRISAGLKYQF